MRWTLIALVLLAAPSGAKVGTVRAYYTGQQLVNICLAKDKVSQWACLGYIAGVSDATQYNPPPDGQICQPSEVKAGTARDEFLFWASQHRDQLHRSATGLVIEALRDRWSCNSIAS